MVWAIAVLMIIAVVFAILRVFMIVPEVAKTADLDVQVYKDQLQSLGSDLERGVITPEEFEAAKLEVSRRILAADRRAQEEVVVSGAVASKPFMAVITLVLTGGSLGLYAIMGAPELPDQPLQARLEAAKVARESRPNQVEAEVQVGQGAAKAAPAIDKDYLKLIEQLRETMMQRPSDPEGWKLLALHEARAGNMARAWRAKEKMIALVGDKVSGEDYADLAEFMIVATKGYVSVEAEEALANALKLDAKSPRARYYSGLALAQNGRPDVAYRMWIGLLEEGPEDAPWMSLIRGQIGPVARAAGINTTDLDAPGPTAGDVEAASQMSAADRMEMIRGMVAGLAERLATEGGTPNEWARLIRAYGTLGETGKASAIWNEARVTFAADADALSILLEAAQAAEVAN